MTSATELTCSELVELVTDYLEDALPARERERFNAHLDGCEQCRAYLQQMRATLTALGRIPAETISPAASAELLAAFRDWSSGG